MGTVKLNDFVNSVKNSTRGDWDGALFCFFSQFSIPVVCAAPLLAAGFPAKIIMLYLIPACVFQHAVGELYCTWMGLRLAKKEGRDDVTSMPGTGVDMVSSLAITFTVVLPVFLDTHDAYLAWGLGLSCNILYGIIKLIMYPVAMKLYKLIPRAVLLGFLGGITLVYVGTISAVKLFNEPYIAFFALAVVFLGMYSKAKLPIPPLAIIFIGGSILGYILGYTPGLGEGFPNFYFFRFTPLGLFHIKEAFLNYAPFIIPLTVGYQLMWTISNIDAAATLGDQYSLKEVLLYDSLLTTIGGALLGSWMPTFILSGHVQWKKAGARTGYTTIGTLLWLITGLSGLLFAGISAIPAGVIGAIFVWFAISTGEVAASGSKKEHLAATFLTFIPVGAYLVQSQLSNIFSTLNIDITLVAEKLATVGVFVESINRLAWGYPLTCIIWGTILVSVIEANYYKAGIFSYVAAALSFMGLMHAPKLGFMSVPFPIIVGYIILGTLLVLGKVLDKSNSIGLDEAEVEAEVAVD